MFIRPVVRGAGRAGPRRALLAGVLASWAMAIDIYYEWICALNICSWRRFRRHLSALRALCFILLLSSCALSPDQQIANLSSEPLVSAPKPYVGLDLDQRTLLANGGFEHGAAQSPDGWQPKGERSRVVTRALAAYAAFATSADKGGVRRIPGIDPV